MHGWQLPPHWTIDEARNACRLLEHLVDALLDDILRQLRELERNAIEDRRQLVLPLVPPKPRPASQASPPPPGALPEPHDDRPT
jgi:hypothetical protein